MSINAINGMNSANSVSASGSSAAPLSEATKKKLEALGIDTTKIKTENEGQLKLKEAQSGQASHAVKQRQQKSNGGSETQALTEQAKALAAQVGVSISSKDELPDILVKISDKLSDMVVQSAKDPQKLQQIKQYESQFASIAGEFLNLEAKIQEKQTKLTGSMDSLASYNKLFHNL